MLALLNDLRFRLGVFDASSNGGSGHTDKRLGIGDGSRGEERGYTV
jgi:hypothetical protein